LNKSRNITKYDQMIGH